MRWVENPAASYGPAQVLFDVTFAIGAGEVVTLLGRNGMGKTTTIRTLMGLGHARRGGALRARAGDRPAVLCALPQARRAAAEPRQPAVRRRAADAGDRPRAH